MASAQQVPSAQQKRFMDLYRQGKIKGALRESKILTKRYPRAPFAWKALGNCLLQLEEFTEAAAALETAFHITPEDPLVLNAFSRACFHTNQLDKALELQEKSLDLEPDNAQGHYNMASMLHQSGNHQDALQHLDHAERLGFDNSLIHGMRSFIFSLVFRFQEGMDELLKLYKLKPDDPTVHNSLGNYYKDMADFPKAEAHYQKAKALAPKYATAYSNEILSLHYNPASTVENILDAAKEWHRQFACQTIPYTHTQDFSASDRKLRVGIVSGSLRMHPVGWMLTSALSNLPEDIELYVYSDSEPNDFIAQRIQQTATQWRPIYQMDQQQVAESIYSDRIHILIDLAGHGTDSRLPAIVMKPAPLIIKWVGMQISSMGIPAFDYFLSDSIETPPGVDDQYTEKLIRLPDDYVCYRPPYYKPAIAALPAITNGYITLGCFNNPAKVNDVVLREWANLMHELPNSHLLLKGGQYSSPEVCERIRNLMTNAGISDERLILEGPSKHQELLESYHRVDIALDPWPYSGGLTTCEAMLMGVPVVTLPGPTFAGRHSATHLTNAGMQELVVSSWEEYRQRVIELASDLPSLALIRAALRTYLEQSPVCDGERFARHLHKALRAIWQRYCEGKPPAALTFNKGGQAWFEDDSSPVKLPTELQRGFDWDLESPVTILDNGAGIAMRCDARELLGSGNIAILTFDPLHALGNAEELAQYGEIQHFPQVTLGNGQPVTLRGIEGENDITSLKPLASGIADSLQTLEIPSIALDSIEGLESLDVLALDDRHDNLAILEHGAKALEKALLLQIRVRFNPTHEGQADLGSLTRWASEHGFRFYRLHNAEYRSHLPDDAPTELKQASELVSADAIFLPQDDRITTLNQVQRYKLALVLDQIYSMHDISYQLLATLDQGKADLYSKKFGVGSTSSEPSNVTEKSESRYINQDFDLAIAETTKERKVAIAELNAALGQRELVFVDTGNMANHGLVRMGQQHIFNVLEAAGCSVSFLRSGQATPSKLIGMAASKNYILYGANRFYDMRINISGFGNHNVFQCLDTPVIGTINDHPYTNFMLERVKNASSTGLLMTIDSVGEELSFLRPDLAHYFSGLVESAPSFYTGCDRPHSERSIDILVPMNLTYAINHNELYENLLGTAQRYGYRHERLVNEVIEAYTDFTESLLSVFKNKYKYIFKYEWKIANSWTSEDAKLLDLLGKIDDLLRARKRIEALKAIANIDAKVRVVILAPEIIREHLSKQISPTKIREWLFVGTVPFEELKELYTQSRYVLNVFPTYHDWLHERSRWATAAGCALISNTNRRALELFTHGKNILFYEQKNINELYSKHANSSQNIGFSAQILLNKKLVSEDEETNIRISAFADYINKFGAVPTTPAVELASSDLPQAPHMSADERILFDKALNKADSYFEFGSGGSTVWAVHKGLEVHGVESDKLWVAALKEKLGEKCQVNFVDIGPTGDWGVPLSNQFKENFKNYSSSILGHVKNFDLVLIDGRFRVACTMATILHILKNSKNFKKHQIFIHDFWNRPDYHVVLDFLDIIERKDSAGLFSLKSGISEAVVATLYRQYAHDPR